MTNREKVLAEIELELKGSFSDSWHEGARALLAVVELHKPFGNAVIWCDQCSCLESEGEIIFYPCPTIQAIEKELAR